MTDTELREVRVVDTALFEAQRAALRERLTAQQQAVDAVVGNLEFLALQAPTQLQVLAQVRALTRQNNNIIRMLLDK